MINKPQIGPMLRLVLGVGAALSLLAQPLLKRRLAKGKEDPDRWREKLGEATQPRPDGPLIWLHGVGVGEVMALRGLILHLSQKRSDLNFLVTSSARSSGNVFAKNLPANTRHQYLPLDFPSPVAAFLEHWKPDLAVWSDQEVWPRLAVEVARRTIPQAYVAARITDASAKAKTRFGAAYGDLFRLLDLRHAQDTGTAMHLSNLMDDDTAILVTGSLKAAAAPLVNDDALLAALPANRPIWVAASAHRADIDLALQAHLIAIADQDTQPLLIIAPRLLATADYVEQACRDLSLTSVKRSNGDMPNNTTQVFVADSFGELGVWYRAAFAALIGGTFDDTQGHNPWEAVALGCAVLHGPKIRNFASDYKQLDQSDAARRVDTAADIVAALIDPELSGTASRATSVRADAAKGLQRISDDLLALLKV